MISGLVIDNFAGGGGASTGIEMALGRPVDVAINHDPEAVAVHRANHPATRHWCKNIWQADPEAVVREAGGGPVALAWFSPDCKHFSKAKGGRPVKRSIRDLAWVVVLWARRARPAVIMLENVEEFRGWGPIDRDGRPCPERKGETFGRWVAELRRLGYRVEWRELRACDYGAPTIRKRLFLVARRDGLPIAWPAPTHGAPDSPGVLAGRLAPWRTAADVIDWSIPCPSIFERARPLAEATLRRIAKGVVRYVLDNPRPFIVHLQHGGRVRPIDDPLHTVTASRHDCNCVAAAHLTKFQENSVGSDLAEPVHTVMAGAPRHALVTAFLAKHYGGVVGSPAAAPIGTVTTVDHHAVVAAGMLGLKGADRRWRGVEEPAATVCAGGGHAAEVRAFLVKYYGTALGQAAGDPLHSATAKARFGVVTVEIDGEPWVVADIGMRMLSPRELFAAQGFPAGYVIDPAVDGRPLTKTAQIRLAGNSVCPDVAAALGRANLGAAVGEREAA